MKSEERVAPRFAYAVWHELRHFVPQLRLKLTTNDENRCTLVRFDDGYSLESQAPRADIAEEFRRFVLNAAVLTQSFDGSRDNEAISWSDGVGPLIRGVGLDRLIIAYELAHRHRDVSSRWGAFEDQWQKDVSNILSFFSQTTQRRYEKSAPHLTVVYSPLETSGPSYGVLGKSLLDEYKALLRLCRDGQTTIVVKRDCVITDILDNRRFDPSRWSLRLPPIQPRLAHLQQLTEVPSDHPLAVFNLNANASMEILAQGKLLFRRVNDVWRFLCVEDALSSVLREMGDCGSREVAHNLLSLAMDLADRGEGALLFLCEEPTDEVLDSILLPEEGLIRFLPGLPYQELTVRTRFAQLIGSRKLSLGEKPYHEITPLLRDLCSIDGATVFSYGGDLLGFGCLVRLNDRRDQQGSHRKEGARSAAAAHVSEKGLAIKVSSDGDATLYIGGTEWGAIS